MWNFIVNFSAIYSTWTDNTTKFTLNRPGRCLSLYIFSFLFLQSALDDKFHSLEEKELELQQLRQALRERDRLIEKINSAVIGAEERMQVAIEGMLVCLFVCLFVCWRRIEPKALAKRTRKLTQVNASFGLAFNLHFVWPPTCVDLRWLALTCVDFGRAQIRTQVDTSWSQVNCICVKFTTFCDLLWLASPFGQGLTFFSGGGKQTSLLL